MQFLENTDLLKVEDMMEIADGLVWREGIAWDMLEVKEGWHESQRV